MKYLCYIFLLVCSGIQAQVTPEISVKGTIAKPYVVTLNDLKSYKTQSIDSLTIRNHKMERKSSLKGIKGVLLKDILEKAEFSVNSPKRLSEFYIVCMADDGYRVVFSWNEIFNSQTGNHVLVVTEIDGKASITQKEGLLLITPTDISTGKRYIKNFSKVLIQKIPE